MVELNKKQLTGIVTLIMILSGAVVVTNMDSSYYCESRDMVLECLRLSSSKITCYTEMGGKRCSEGWQPLENFIEGESNTFYIEANGCVFTCKTDGGGYIGSYDVCRCEKATGVEEAYLFEITGKEDG